MIESTVSGSNLADALAQAFPQSRPDTRAALVGSAELRTLGADETFIRQGDESSMALVLDGHVAVRRTTVDGRQLIVRIVGRGAFAPILPLAALPAAADAVALTPSSAAVWRGKDVRALATSDPGLAVDILDQALQSLEEVVGRLDTLHHQDALRRVARVLHQRADLFFADPPVLSRAHLPNLVGTSREMTGRMLRLLESQGIVARIERDRLRLLDPAGLADAAEHCLEDGRPVDRSPSTRRLTRGGAGGH